MVEVVVVVVEDGRANVTIGEGMEVEIGKIIAS